MNANTEHVDVSRHKCLIYDGDPSEQLPVIVPLLMDGLRERRRCLYLGSPDMISVVESALDARGIDTAREAERGALIFSSDRSHLRDGFDPHAMVDMLATLIDDAVDNGFEGLCATGDMMWELGEEKNFERLLEYEALLEQVFRHKPLSGICQYHRSTVPGSAIQDALLVHRSLYLGSVFNRDNLFYVPPELLLDNREARDKQGAWMCQQIIRILNAERKRDEALAALQVSEAQQRQLAEELAQVNWNLERRVRERTAELQNVNKELEAFSYSVSHDLRAPVRHIDGFSQILLEQFGEVLGEGTAYVDRIRGSARVMDELIEGMLALSRVSKKEVGREMVDLGAIAETIANTLRANEPHRRVRFTIGKNLRVTGDPILLRAAMENLIGNAWKFTSKRETALIAVAKHSAVGDAVVFSVTDNGAGFDMQHAKKLFGAFQRLHSQQDFQGVGVGLATVQRIITRHGGRIWAEGRPGEGATFFFSIPDDTSS